MPQTLMRFRETQPEWIRLLVTKIKRRRGFRRRAAFPGGLPQFITLLLAQRSSLTTEFGRLRDNGGLHQGIIDFRFTEDSDICTCHEQSQ
jgi:hypothetical protein